jgi:hypothetical protein
MPPEQEQPREAAAIPPAAAAVVGLLNSRPHATPLLPDTLENPQIGAGILRPFGLSGAETPTPKQLGRVRVLRSALMATVEADDPPGAASAWADVDAQTTDLLFRYTFAGTGQTGLRQMSGDQIVGGIVRAVTDLLAANHWTRIRACANDLCSHVFYDATRSHTQRWHSYETCGNRINVAAHRARSRPTRADG